MRLWVQLPLHHRVCKGHSLLSMSLLSISLKDISAAGKRLHAYVELEASDSVAPHADVSQQLTQWCRERLTRASVPSSFFMVSQLPRSSAGKLQRSRLCDIGPVHQDSAEPALAASAALQGYKFDPTSEADVMRAFQAALGGLSRSLEPVTSFWAAAGDSRAAMQVRLAPHSASSAV